LHIENSTVGNVSAARKGAHKIIVCLGCPFVAAGATPGDDSYGSGRALQALPQWVRFPPSPRSGMWCKGERAWFGTRWTGFESLHPDFMAL
jgi:hypothetical protein